MSLTFVGCKEQVVESKPQIDAEIMSDLKAIVQHCKIGVSGNTVNDCKDKEKSKLVEKFNKKLKDRAASLDTFAVALESEDDKLSVAASSVLYSAFRNFGKVDIGYVKPEIARRIIKAVGKVKKYRAAQAVKASVHAAMLAEQSEELYKMLDTHSYESLPGLAYPHIMYYARMNAFPKVKALAKSPEEKIAQVAFRAPLNLPKPQQSELDTICPWAQSYLGDKRERVFTAAGRVMLTCKGKYIDALLDEGEKRLSNHQFTRDYYLLYRDVCFSFMKGVIKEPGKKAQCDRTAKYLEAVVNDEKVESLPRGLALFAIYYQRRNLESLKVMRKYENHSDPKVKKYAKESIDSLVNHYKIKEK